MELAQWQHCAGKSEHHRAGWSPKATGSLVTPDKGKCHRDQSTVSQAQASVHRKAEKSSLTYEVIPGATSGDGKPHPMQGCNGRKGPVMARHSFLAAA